MEKSLLKLATIGDVDNGKSTLMGRLLYETHNIYEDQYESVKKISQKKGSKEVDLSLFLDGLSAEREQGITIDVAYRYFRTNKRKFIIADCPGHKQYTRNMITGCSTSDLAIILIDAIDGVKTQSKRHGFLVSLLGIQHLVVAINKMDLIQYDQTIYNKIVEEFTKFVEKLNISNIMFIPISGLKGDNVVHLSTNMSWYQSVPLLNYLENVQVNLNQNKIDFRFPVQTIIRENSIDFRGFAGTVISGAVQKGDEIIVLPSKQESKIKSIEFFNKHLNRAETGQSVVLTLENDIDISRGNLIVKKQNIPIISNQFEATLCCLNGQIIPNKQYILKHTSHKVNAYITNIQYKIDVNTLHKQEVEELQLNEIGKVIIKTTNDLFFDSYLINKNSGSLN
jgi:bifunctional enzyme CysN/CysC